MKYVYKSVAAILAIVVILVAICSPLFSITIDTPLGSILTLFGSYLKNEKALELLEQYEGRIPESVYVDFKITDLISPSESSLLSIVNSFSGDADISDNLIEVLKPAFPSAIVFASVFLLIIICALAIILCAFVCKNNRVVIYLSIVGCGLNLLLFKTFEDFARVFTDGTITLADLAGTEWITLLGEIKELAVPSTMWFVAVIFVCVIIWTVLYNITLPESEKVARKRMLGEID